MSDEQEFFSHFAAPDGRLGGLDAARARCEDFVRAAAAGVPVFGDTSTGLPVEAVWSGGRWTVMTRDVASVMALDPVPAVPCEAHPTRDAPLASHPYVVACRSVHVRQVDPDTGAHIADGEVDAWIEAAYICDDCDAYTRQPRVREQMEPLIERMHDPQQFVAACPHLVIGTGSQALACGECADGGLRCDRCAMEHAFAGHVRADDFHGCGICGRGPLYVPRLLPVGRLDRSVATGRGEPLIHFRGWVWASIRPPKRCVEHMRVGAVVR